MTEQKLKDMSFDQVLRYINTMEASLKAHKKQMAEIKTYVGSIDIEDKAKKILLENSPAG